MLKEQLDAYIAAHGALTYSLDERLSEHTTFRIGGPADFYVVPETADALADALRLCREAGVKTYILGRGSDVVFDDAGFRGAVISTLSLDGVTVNGDRLVCGAGAYLSRAAVAAREASLTGFEFAHGIPGSVGGAVRMNAGAYGGEIAAVLEESTYYDAETGTLGTLTAPEHGFGYRESVYAHHPAWIVTSATFALSAGDPVAIGALMDDLAARRREKQPLEYPSAGSVFKRSPGYFMGQLIEEAGLKGRTVGGAQVSEKHAGFIVNRGGATAKNVRELVQVVKMTLESTFGITPECEIIFVDA